MDSDGHRAAGQTCDSGATLCPRFQPGSQVHGDLGDFNDGAPWSPRDARIWDKGGVVAASVQAEQSPPIEITGMVKDGDTLVLTTTRFENGKPIWAVVALTLDGDTMKMAQMLEPSRSIKLGSGKRQ